MAVISQINDKYEDLEFKIDPKYIQLEAHTLYGIKFKYPISTYHETLKVFNSVCRVLDRKRLNQKKIRSELGNYLKMLQYRGQRIQH